MQCRRRRQDSHRTCALIGLGLPTNADLSTPRLELPFSKRNGNYKGIAARKTIHKIVFPRLGSLNSMPKMVRDERGRLPTFFPSPCRRSNAKGALARLAERPPAQRVQGDRGHDAGWLRKRDESPCPAFRPTATRGARPPTTASPTRSAAGSRMPSRASMTGEASPCAIPAAATCPFPPRRALPPSSPGCHHEAGALS